MSDVIIPSWTLGERLEKARTAAGLEREDIARELGMTTKTVWNYENGYTTPKLIVLKVYHDLTGVPLWWLLDEREPTDGAASAGRYTGQLVIDGLFGLAA